MLSDKEIFALSRQYWGLHSQIDMLAEESSELSSATLHLNRANKDKAEAWENFSEEIADVEFMIEEMKEYFPVLQAKVNMYRKIKAERVSKLLLNARGSMCGTQHEFKEGCCAHAPDADCHIFAKR